MLRRYSVVSTGFQGFMNTELDRLTDTESCTIEIFPALDNNRYASWLWCLTESLFSRMIDETVEIAPRNIWLQFLVIIFYLWFAGEKLSSPIIIISIAVALKLSGYFSPPAQRDQGKKKAHALMRDANETDLEPKGRLSKLLQGQ